MVCRACVLGVPLRDDECAELDSRNLTEVGIQVMSWRGWKISYRTKQPDKESVEACSARIANKQKHSIDIPFSTVCSRTKSGVERKAASDAQARIRKVRADAQKAAGVDAW